MQTIRKAGLLISDPSRWLTVVCVVGECANTLSGFAMAGGDPRLAQKDESGDEHRAADRRA
jgi:hypothetical protein